MIEINAALDSISCKLPEKPNIAEIISSALISADPYRAVIRNILIGEGQIKLGDYVYSLYSDSRMVVVGLGKAAPKMLFGARTAMGELIQSGVCVSKHFVEVSDQVEGVHYLVGNHPVPGEGSLTAGAAIQEAVYGLNSDDLVLLLLSGGGSALATLPVGGVSLSDLQQLTSCLLRSGASINEINTVRKHLDLIKGGGLLRMAAPANVAALVLSDVVGSPLDVIASGPAYPDSSSFEEAYRIVEEAGGFGTIPESILSYLKRGIRGEIAETIKPGDALATNGHNTIIGSNLDACRAAVERAIELGFHAELVTDHLTGEAQQAGEYLALVARERVDLPRPYVLVFGGETTVSIHGAGKGGRNQEVALAAVEELAGLEDILLITVATDGEDGPTKAAGAVVDGSSFSRANSLGLHPAHFLANNDAYNFFVKTGDLLVTGPTGTNVNDISFLFGF